MQQYQMDNVYDRSLNLLCLNCDYDHKTKRGHSYTLCSTRPQEKEIKKT